MSDSTEAVPGSEAEEAPEPENSFSELLRRLPEYQEAARERVKALRVRAEKGDAEAQYHLGLAYEHGDGVKSDNGQAAGWYRKASEQKHPEAQFLLGQLYLGGDGVEKDHAAGLLWCRRAAEQGLAVAQTTLGSMYEWSSVVETDYIEALKWNWRAAQQGNAIGQFNMGSMYATSHGVEVDLVEVYAWYSLASDRIEDAAGFRDELEQVLTEEQLARGRQRVRELQARFDARTPTTSDPGGIAGA